VTLCKHNPDDYAVFVGLKLEVCLLHASIIALGHDSEVSLSAVSNDKRASSARYISLLFFYPGTVLDVFLSSLQYHAVGIRGVKELHEQHVRTSKQFNNIWFRQCFLQQRNLGSKQFDCLKKQFHSLLVCTSLKCRKNRIEVCSQFVS
jgi:hypothetical protein